MWMTIYWTQMTPFSYGELHSRLKQKTGDDHTFNQYISKRMLVTTSLFSVVEKKTLPFFQLTDSRHVHDDYQDR